MVETAAAQLVDWDTAARVGERISGASPRTAPEERARLHEDFADVTREADDLVSRFTGLPIPGPHSRPWVMRRREWIGQNLRGFAQVLEPVAHRLSGRTGGVLGPVRRKALGMQIGGILGYVGRKVLGQYDLFLPPDDRDLVYFVGPNVLELERRYRFPPRDFRLWLALHEVTHRAQLDGVPWMRGYVEGLIDGYLKSIELDPRALMERLRRALEDVRRSGRRFRSAAGFLVALMTPEQRDTFHRMQALMSLLEGHATFVMNGVAPRRVLDADRMQQTLHERRNASPMNRAVQKAVGLDVKVQQYDAGERFVREVTERAGPEGFARVWERPEHLPEPGEIPAPAAWVERVAS